MLALIAKMANVLQNYHNSKSDFCHAKSHGVAIWDAVMDDGKSNLNLIIILSILFPTPQHY